MPLPRSCDLIVRTLEEHADAFFVVGVRPDGVPFMIARACNPAYCMALNAMLVQTLNSGGLTVGKPGGDA